MRFIAFAKMQQRDLVKFKAKPCVVAMWAAEKTLTRPYGHKEFSRVSGSPDPAIPEVSVLDVWTALDRDGAAQLIDVRTRAEWTYVGVPELAARGRQVVLAEWQSFPSNQVDSQFVERLKEALNGSGSGQQTELFFMCRSGVRSLAAARAMTAAGFTRCRNVTGGFEGQLDPDRHRGRLAGWKAAGLPWVQG